MRAYLPDYEIKTPRNFSEALELLAHVPGVWRPFAGGTDLMVLLEAGKLEHKKYLNIWSLSELQGVTEEPAWIRIGALTTYTQIRAHPILQKEFPLLCQAAGLIGCVAIQNRGTLGGNIVNASPAADAPPALLVYEAELELVSRRGRRRLPYYAFHKGYKQMQLEPDELLEAVFLPRLLQNPGNPGGGADGAGADRGWRHYYRKVGTRKMQAVSKVCFAGLAKLQGSVVAEIRIALGSVAPVPLRCFKTEAALRRTRLTPAVVAQAQNILAQEIAPIDDIRSTARYKTDVVANLLADFLG